MPQRRSSDPQPEGVETVCSADGWQQTLWLAADALPQSVALPRLLHLPAHWVVAQLHGLLLGPFSTTLRAGFDFDYWLRASTRVHPATISTTQLPQAQLVAAQLQARHFGVAGSYMLTSYFTALTAGELSPPHGENLH